MHYTYVSVMRCGFCIASDMITEISLSFRVTISACRNDDELNKLLADVTITQGGVLPNIQPSLLPKRSKGKGGEPVKKDRRSNSQEF